MANRFDLTDEIDRMQAYEAKTAIPLPEPVDDVRVTWRGETEFLRSEADYYTADQMRAYAAAVSAAKDAEIAALRAEVAQLREDAARYRWLRNNPEWLGWDHDFRPDEVDREIDAARKGTTPTTRPPSPSPRS